MSRCIDLFGNQASKYRRKSDENMIFVKVKATDSWSWTELELSTKSHYPD